MYFFVSFILGLLCVCIDTSVISNIKADEKHEYKEMEIYLFPGQVLVRQLPRSVSAILLVQNISNSTSSLVCQVHIQHGNLTLSLTPAASIGTVVTGSNIGIVTVLKHDQDSVSWHLISKHNVSVTALFYVTALDQNDPLPGGCSQEFDLKNDPNIQIKHSPFLHHVIFWLSSVGFPRDPDSLPDCENSTKQGSLEYVMYAYYMKEDNFNQHTFFEAMRKMLKPEDIVKYGIKVKSFHNIDTPNVAVPSYEKQGVIYNLIVREKNSGMLSAYVPRSTYTCNLDDNSCQAVNVGGIVLATVGGAVGLFILFLGHRFFKTENFIFGFLAFALIFYLVFVSSTEESNTVCLVLAGVFGIIGGLVWLAFWWNCGIPLASVFLIGLVAGFLFTSVLFYTPFGDLSYLQNGFHYGVTFVCGCLIVPVILLCFTRILNIFACAFVGSFCIVLALDYYLFGGLKLILVNSMRHATVSGYCIVTVIGPFQTNDIILSVIWLFLLVLGMTFQLYRETGKAPFPQCPKKKRQMRLQPILSRHFMSEPGDDDVRQPLVPESTPHSYVTSTIPEEPHQSVPSNLNVSSTPE